MKAAANDFIRLRNYYKKKEGLGGVLTFDGIIIRTEVGALWSCDVGGEEVAFLNA